MTPDVLSATGELGKLLRVPVDPRSVAVRFSRLKAMRLSPAHYLDAVTRNDPDESLALRLGSGVHAVVLGNPVVRFEGRRYGKEWDAFERKHAGETILNPREWDEAHAMAGAILTHPIASSLLFEGDADGNGMTIEKPIDWTLMGRKCRSTPDSHGRGRLVELKTARTAHPEWFARDAIKLHYHAQLAFYREAIQSVTPSSTPLEVYVCTVEKTPPYCVTVFRVTERALDLGARLVRLWFEQLLACEASGEWPQYAGQIVPLDAPVDDESVSLTIDGETLEVA